MFRYPTKRGTKWTRPTSERVRQRLALKREYRLLTEQISLLPPSSKMRLYFEARRAAIGRALETLKPGGVK